MNRINVGYWPYVTLLNFKHEMQNDNFNSKMINYRKKDWYENLIWFQLFMYIRGPKVI